MRSGKLRVFTWLNILVIIAALLGGFVASLLSQKQIEADLFYIAPRLNDNRYFFSEIEVAELRAICQPLRLSPLSLGNGVIRHGNFSAYSKIIYTDQPPTVNESLAWQLFGSLDVVGKSVETGGERYTISSVEKQDSLTKGDFCLYLPLETRAGERDISAVFLHVANYNTVGPYEAISGWLRGTGKDIRDYFLTDINRYLANIGVKYKLMLAFISLYAATTLGAYAYRALKGRARPVRQAIIPAALSVVALALVVTLLQGIALTIWAPNGAGFKLNEIIATIINRGFLPGQEYLPINLQEIVKLNAYGNAALIAGGVALLNFIFVHSWRFDTKKEI